MADQRAVESRPALALHRHDYGLAVVHELSAPRVFSPDAVPYRRPRHQERLDTRRRETGRPNDQKHLLCEREKLHGISRCKIAAAIATLTDGLVWLISTWFPTKA